MKLIVEGEASARLELAGAGFDIESEDGALSPYHLLAGSIAGCTALTLQSWSSGAGIDLEPLVIHVAWEKARERPARIARIEMELWWPGFPEERMAAAERVADLCPIHATLARAAEVTRRLVPLPPAGAG